MAEIPDELNRYLERARKPHTFRPIYVPEGDCLVHYENDQPCTAKRLHDLVTIYLADDDGSLVGWKIKDISRLLKQYGSFGVALEGKGFFLGFLFLLAGVRPDDEEVREIFSAPMVRRRITLPSELVPA